MEFLLVVAVVAFLVWTHLQGPRRVTHYRGPTGGSRDGVQRDHLSQYLPDAASDAGEEDFE